MATRLYPGTQDVATLERLADVEPGTAARLAKLEAADDSRYCDSDATEWNDAFCAALALEPNLEKYRNFVTFGWGRVAVFAALAIRLAELDPVCGGAVELETVRKIRMAKDAFRHGDARHRGLN